MACNALMVPTSTATAAAAAAGKDVFKEHKGLHKSLSGQDLVMKGRGIRRSHSDNQLCCCCVNSVNAASARPKLKTSRSVGMFSFQISSSIIPKQIKSLLFDSEISQDVGESEKDSDVEVSLEMENVGPEKVKRENWVERMMEIRRQWKNEQKKESLDVDCDCGDDPCVVDYGDEEEEQRGEDDNDHQEQVGYDREAFSRLLVKVPWSDTRQFSQLASLSNMAYVIPEITADDLDRFYGLKFVTSSLEKKAKAAILRERLEKDSTGVPVSVTEESEKSQIRSSAAYKIAASAASYIQSCSQDTPSQSSDTIQQTLDASQNSNLLYKSAAAAQAATSTMTAVVAAGEKERQEAAIELQSLCSSPCEWFACDDPSAYTRCFVIQGSDSLASWQANLFFEPTNFEGTDALVHRGIYEAAKGIYEQFMPEIIDHLKKHGDRAKFQFTGHSLGGSLSLIVNLMLLARGMIKPEALKPVVTFGSPFVFCGGQRILDELGLDESYVHCVMMHRDIVPRAFSCNYPNHVALLLKRLNGAFQSHPCLDKKKLLYSPMGKVFILQPNEKASPPHPLLPPGNALYALDKNRDGYSPNALRAFLNRPHPLETLSHPTAYGSDGSILRDHDSSNYVKAVNGVLRQQTKLVVRKVRKQRQMLWTTIIPPPHGSWRHDDRISGPGRPVVADHEVITRV